MGRIGSRGRVIGEEVRGMRLECAIVALRFYQQTNDIRFYEQSRHFIEAAGGIERPGDSGLLPSQDA